MVQDLFVEQKTLNFKHNFTPLPWFMSHESFFKSNPVVRGTRTTAKEQKTLNFKYNFTPLPWFVSHESFS